MNRCIVVDEKGMVYFMLFYMMLLSIPPLLDIMLHRLFLSLRTKRKKRRSGVGVGVGVKVGVGVGTRIGSGVRSRVCVGVGVGFYFCRVMKGFPAVYSSCQI